MKFEIRDLIVQCLGEPWFTPEGLVQCSILIFAKNIGSNSQVEEVKQACKQKSLKLTNIQIIKGNFYLMEPL